MIRPFCLRISHLHPRGPVIRLRCIRRLGVIRDYNFQVRVHIQLLDPLLEHRASWRDHKCWQWMPFSPAANSSTVRARAAAVCLVLPRPVPSATMQPPMTGFFKILSCAACLSGELTVAGPRGNLLVIVRIRGAKLSFNVLQLMEHS